MLASEMYALGFFLPFRIISQVGLILPSCSGTDVVIFLSPEEVELPEEQSIESHETRDASPSTRTANGVHVAIQAEKPQSAPLLEPVQDSNVHHSPDDSDLQRLANPDASARTSQVVPQDAAAADVQSGGRERNTVQNIKDRHLHASGVLELDDATLAYSRQKAYMHGAPSHAHTIDQTYGLASEAAWCHWVRLEGLSLMETCTPAQRWTTTAPAKSTNDDTGAQRYRFQVISLAPDCQFGNGIQSLAKPGSWPAHEELIPFIVIKQTVNPEDQVTGQHWPYVALGSCFKPSKQHQYFSVVTRIDVKTRSLHMVEVQNGDERVVSIAEFFNKQWISNPVQPDPAAVQVFWTAMIGREWRHPMIYDTNQKGNGGSDDVTPPSSRNTKKRPRDATTEPGATPAAKRASTEQPASIDDQVLLKVLEIVKDLQKRKDPDITLTAMKKVLETFTATSIGPRGGITGKTITLESFATEIKQLRESLGALAETIKTPAEPAPVQAGQNDGVLRGLAMMDQRLNSLDSLVKKLPEVIAVLLDQRLADYDAASDKADQHSGEAPGSSNSSFQSEHYYDETGYDDATEAAAPQRAPAQQPLAIAPAAPKHFNTASFGAPDTPRETQFGFGLRRQVFPGAASSSSQRPVRSTVNSFSSGPQPDSSPIGRIVQGNFSFDNPAPATFRNIEHPATQRTPVPSAATFKSGTMQYVDVTNNKQPTKRQQSRGKHGTSSQGLASPTPQFNFQVSHPNQQWK